MLGEFSPLEIDDVKWMLRVRDGDEEAFRELVEKYQTSIRNLCFRLIGNREDAEEVALEVFVQLYLSRHRYKPEAKLSTYLYRIAMTRSLNRIRDQKRKRAISLEFLKEEGRLDPEISPSDLPDVQLEQKEMEARVRNALEALPEKQRTALVLRRYEELSYEEIASIMGISVSAVEALLHRARETLRKRLKGLFS